MMTKKKKFYLKTQTEKNIRTRRGIIMFKYINFFVKGRGSILLQSGGII